MFDIEKAKEKGLDENTIKIMEKINKNQERCDGCKGHDFERTRARKYICKNCGFECGCEYVDGYFDAKKHYCESGGKVK